MSIWQFIRQVFTADKRADASRSGLYNQLGTNSSERNIRSPPPPPGHQDSRSPDMIIIDVTEQDQGRELSQSEVLMAIFHLHKNDCYFFYQFSSFTFSKM